MKHLVAKLLVALALATSALTFTVFNPGTPVVQLNRFERAQMQTVLIRSADGGEGSGVIVERTNPDGEKRFFAWTAAHVVAGFTEVEVVRIGRENAERIDCELTFPAFVISFSEAEDLALLWVQIPASFVLPVEFQFNLPHVGDPVVHVGNYEGGDYDQSVATGIVAQIGVHPPFPDWPRPLLDQTDALVIPGSSGGGIFDADGKVLGIVVARHELGISFYVPTRQILKWSVPAGVTWALMLDWCPSDDALKPHS